MAGGFGPGLCGSNGIRGPGIPARSEKFCDIRVLISYFPSLLLAVKNRTSDRNVRLYR